jgi:hypothetical protein
MKGDSQVNAESRRMIMNADRQKSIAEMEKSPGYLAWREHLQWELRWIALELLVFGVGLALVLMSESRSLGEILVFGFLVLDFLIRYRRYSGKRKRGPVPAPHRSHA